MIIFRYLAREVLTTLAALTGLLLLIFLSNIFVRYLARAAAGKLPGMIVLKLMMLEVPHLLGLLLPLGFFIGILLAYGRLYADNEMTVLAACGMGRNKLIAMTMVIAAFVMFFVGTLSLWLGPKILADRDKLISAGQSASIVELLIPGRFQSTPGGKQVLYVEKMSRGRSHAEQIFLADQVTRKRTSATHVNHWNVLTAEQGFVEPNRDDSGNSAILLNGYRYIGTPGKKDFQVIKFKKYGMRLAQGQPKLRKPEISMATSKLWPLDNKNPKLAAELQWRLSFPIMVMVLGLLAIPMSRVKPRQSKYVTLLPAILLVIVYANMMFVSRDWVASGKVSAKLGMWWLHGAYALLALLLLYGPGLRRWLKRRSVTQVTS